MGGVRKIGETNESSTIQLFFTFYSIFSQNFLARQFTSSILSCIVDPSNQDLLGISFD
jgi:hypothetical protein